MEADRPFASPEGPQALLERLRESLTGGLVWAEKILFVFLFGCTAWHA